MSKIHNRGGAREGAGRKKIDPEKKTVTKSFSMERNKIRQLGEYSTAMGISQSAALNNILEIFFTEKVND